MNIAIDLRPLLHGKVSGVSTYTSHLTSEMIKHKDHEFVLFLSGSRDDYMDILEGFSGDNVRKFFLKTPNRLFNLKQIFLGWPKVDLLIKKELGIEIDVFFLPDMRPLALSKRIKKVCTCHDLSFFRYPRCFSRKSKFWYFLNRPKNYFRSADKVVSVSEFTQNELKDVFSVESEVVYEGVKLERGGDLGFVREKYHLPDKFLLSLSTLEPRKNLERAVKAFIKADLPGFKLVLAGEDNQDIFAEFRIPKSEKVQFIGFVDERDKESVYKLSQGLLYISLYEGFGLPVLEAFSCGVPVLTSKNSPMQEICDDEAVYANPCSVRSITEGIEVLISGKWDARKLKDKASKFSWEKAAEKTLFILGNVVRNKD
ncbi:MAG: glycosyltransferase family 1 protein [Patescibacteria group bacterium]|nr:glycosyltransferase family 4 protein [Patescibacteria group bacterium]